MNAVFYSHIQGGTAALRRYLSLDTSIQPSGIGAHIHRFANGHRTDYAWWRQYAFHRAGIDDSLYQHFDKWNKGTPCLGCSWLYDAVRRRLNIHGLPPYVENGIPFYNPDRLIEEWIRMDCANNQEWALLETSVAFIQEAGGHWTEAI